MICYDISCATQELQRTGPDGPRTTFPSLDRAPIFGLKEVQGSTARITGAPGINASASGAASTQRSQRATAGALQGEFLTPRMN